VAVISTPDEKWGERPLLVIQPRNGEPVDVLRLIDSLRGKVPDWWIPERIAQVRSMPLAASGKIDKNRLRAELDGGDMAVESINA
jgi:fatty-acyl-CoA synthase